MDIILCEDNYEQRMNLEKIIKKELGELSLEFKIVLSSGKSDEVVSYLSNSKSKPRIYFLDVELENGESGLELGRTIRECDKEGYIIYVSSHMEKPLLTFKYKVQALDFIFKFDVNINSRVKECLEIINSSAYKFRGDKEGKIPIDTGNKIYLLDFNEILFFETTGKNRKIRVHILGKQIEFYGTIKDIEKRVSKDFYKAHKSYLVNTKNIKEIDKKTLLVKMINGEEFYASRLNMKGLINLCCL